jgi:phenylacetate-CoA ligase
MSLETLSYNHKETGGFKKYFDFNIGALERNLIAKDANFWLAAGQKKALALFKAAAVRVPAYKDFLKKHKIHADKINSAGDFRQVPPTDKTNYISAYPLAARAWDGKLTGSDVVASSSGTSGEANYWPRGGAQELEAAVIHELIYKYSFGIDRRKTLIIISFPMGVYVSGLATVLPSWMVAQKHNMTVAAAGNNKPEVLKLVKNLSPGYGQTILVGHPFFIKDVLESGPAAGINWKKLQLNLMFCSEGFSESWRDYVCSLAGIKNKFLQTASTYGCSEMLLIAYETPISILLKQLAEKNPVVAQKLFSIRHAPSLFQYHPLLRHIEPLNKELLFTSNSGLPLVRFNLHDQGAILPLSLAREVLDEHQPTWKTQTGGRALWQLPLAALWGRSDQTVVFYAANIYPQHIHAALHQSQFLPKLTGKFTLRKDYYKNMDEFLEINLELRPGIQPAVVLAKAIREQVITTLRRINIEYLFISEHLDKDVRPKIKLWPYQHSRYFKAGLKPKYIIPN